MVNGAADLVRSLDGMAVAMRDRVAREALQAGLDAVAKSAKSNVPARYRGAKKFIRTAIDRKNGSLMGRVGWCVGMPRRSHRKTSRGSGITQDNIHLLVGGTRRRRTGKGANRGSSPAVLGSVLDDAWSQSRESTVETMGNVIKQRVR